MTVRKVSESEEMKMDSVQSAPLILGNATFASDYAEKLTTDMGW
jgi:hypothetical protein